jgi:hypothetical protein
VTNDPHGGVCNAKEKRSRREASKNRKGACQTGGCRSGKKRRSGMVRGRQPRDGTARPVNAEGKRIETSRESSAARDCQPWRELTRPATTVDDPR